MVKVWTITGVGTVEHMSFEHDVIVTKVVDSSFWVTIDVICGLAVSIDDDKTCVDKDPGTIDEPEAVEEPIDEPIDNPEAIEDVEDVAPA